MTFQCEPSWSLNFMYSSHTSCVNPAQSMHEYTSSCELHKWLAQARVIHLQIKATHLTHVSEIVDWTRSADRVR